MSSCWKLGCANVVRIFPCIALRAQSASSVWSRALRLSTCFVWALALDARSRTERLKNTRNHAFREKCCKFVKCGISLLRGHGTICVERTREK